MSKTCELPGCKIEVEGGDWWGQEVYQVTQENLNFLQGALTSSTLLFHILASRNCSTAGFKNEIQVQNYCLLRESAQEGRQGETQQRMQHFTEKEYAGIQ